MAFAASRGKGSRTAWALGKHCDHTYDVLLYGNEREALLGIRQVTTSGALPANSISVDSDNSCTVFRASSLSLVRGDYRFDGLAALRTLAR